MIKIICGSCTKPLSIDETKLPMKEVSFPCPLCKTKLRIDRSQLPDQGEEPHLAEVVGAASSPSPSAEAAPKPVAAPAHPSAAPGPKALIVGENSAEVQAAVTSLGFSPLHRATAAEGREYFVQEFPEVVFLVPPAITQPPMDELIPMTSVGGPERRRGFFILVGEKFRSLDGNAAFLYGVNMVVAKKDLPSMAKLYQEARDDHDRLAKPFTQFASE